MATGLVALPLLFIRKKFSGGIIDSSLFPEGLAVGVGGFSKNAYSLTFAIGAQNILV